MAKRSKKTPHQRIMIAAKKGIGLHLSDEEVFYLSNDDAIATRADCDDLNDQGISDDEIDCGWENRQNA